MPEAADPKLPLDRVLAGDCVEEMRRLPAGCADLIFADPPYNLQLEGTLLRPNLSVVDGVDDAWDQFGEEGGSRFDSFEEYDRFTEAWLTAARHALSPTGTIWVIGSYHNIYRVGRIMLDLGYWLLNDILWIKTNPMPNFRGVRFTNAHETLLWAKRTKGQKSYTFNHHTMKRYNDGKQMRSDWTLPVCTGDERLKVNGDKAHTTQKPEALLERVIVSSSKVGDTVLDPFFGTGTTGAVAKRLGRHYLGIEREEQYLQVARERLARVQPEPQDWLREHTQDAPLPPRVPFERLLELGLLHPGEVLQHLRGGQAVINADGTLTAEGRTGSIHRIGAYVGGTQACNGWDYWLYAAPETGELRLIEELRRQVREQPG